jgi:hypothetical protein
MEIKGYENYLIFDDGDVYNTNNNRFLKPSCCKNGYKRINLYNDGKSKTFLIHRLVALHYLPNPDPENNLEVDHRDRDTHNNHILNLRWVNRSENNLNKNFKGNTIGYKNICKDKNGYRISIKRNNLNYRKYKYTLEEAIKQRDLMLLMWD